jgi:uncharacterized protein YndB with AHSA1/START domain
VIEPLRLAYDVACPVQHAWDVWTTKFSLWWPKAHTASGEPDAEVTLEPGVGGRLFERTSRREDIDWGRVTQWEPPNRLAYTWHIGHDASEATLVELSFVAVGENATRLEIVQTGFDKLGEVGLAYREGNTAGWGALIPNFIAVATPTA